MLFVKGVISQNLRCGSSGYPFLDFSYNYHPYLDSGKKGTLYATVETINISQVLWNLSLKTFLLRMISDCWKFTHSELHIMWKMC